MENKKPTIKELLQSMYTLNVNKESKSSIPNTAETWARIGAKESFSAIGFADEDEMSKWIEENDYQNIVN